MGRADVLHACVHMRYGMVRGVLVLDVLAKILLERSGLIQTGELVGFCLKLYPTTP